MNLIKKIRTFSFTAAAIRTFGALFLLSGLIGTVMQTGLVGAGTMSNTELLEAMQADDAVMVTATWSLILQALEACALPLYAFLLVEGITHTSSFGRYYLRVLGLAVVCQLPYNLVMTGNAMVMQALNPVFSLVMAMTMVYFFRRFPKKSFSHIAIKILAVMGTFLWSNMLGIEHGAACVLLTAVLWGLRGKPNLQTFAGVMVSFACCVFSLYYLAAPLSFLILYFYGGEKGSGSRIVNYAVYPVLLLAVGLLRVFG